MEATLALREKAMQLLAADAATLAPAVAANLIRLVIAPFTPAETLLLADLVFATFTGSTALAVGVGAQPEGLDPTTSDSIVTIKPPAGGWRWETTDTVNLPQTVHGFALLTDGSAALLASELFPTPITLTDTNQVIELSYVHLRQMAGSIV